MRGNRACKIVKSDSLSKLLELSELSVAEVVAAAGGGGGGGA
jgi:hypothetical protein